MRAVKDPGILRGLHRREIEVGVALFLRLHYFFERNAFTFRNQFMMAALGPRLGARREEELALGVRENESALIAALAQNVAAGGDAALLRGQIQTNRRDHRDLTRTLRRFGRTDRD